MSSMTRRGFLGILAAIGLTPQFPAEEIKTTLAAGVPSVPMQPPRLPQQVPSLQTLQVSDCYVWLNGVDISQHVTRAGLRRNTDWVPCHSVGDQFVMHVRGLSTVEFDLETSGWEPDLGTVFAGEKVTIEFRPQYAPIGNTNPKYTLPSVCRSLTRDHFPGGHVRTKSRWAVLLDNA